MAPVEEGTAAAGGVEAEDDAGGLGAGKSSYVPPHMRKGGAGGGEKMGGRFEKDDLATLRVTNVCFAIILLSTSSTSVILVYLGSVLTLFFSQTGQRVGRGERVAGSLRTFRSCHQSLPCTGSGNPESQGLCFHQLCGSWRRSTCLREGGWLYVFNIPFRGFLSTSSSSANLFFC